MKKTLLLLTIALLSVATVSKGYSQDLDKKSKKEQRKLERQEAEKDQEILIKKMLEEKSFSFTATEIESTGRAAVSNIRLKSLWFIDVSSSSLKCFLPIYGTASPVSNPTILRKMDFIARDYEYELTTAKKVENGYKLKVVTSDNRSNTEYTFEFSIPLNGENVGLVVSSNFNAPVYFTGRITD